MDQKELGNKWHELVDILNNLPGARKDLKQWKSMPTADNPDNLLT